jgi:hypothetical protein
MKMVLGENQVNEILKAWVENRKQLQHLYDTGMLKKELH